MRFLSPYSPYPHSSPDEMDMCETPLSSGSGHSSPWVVVNESISAWSYPPSISPHLLRDTSPFVGYAFNQNLHSVSEERTEPGGSPPGRNFSQAEQQAQQLPPNFNTTSEGRLGIDNSHRQPFEPGLNLAGFEYSNGLDWRSSMTQTYGLAPSQHLPQQSILSPSPQLSMLAQTLPALNYPSQYGRWTNDYAKYHDDAPVEPVTVKLEEIQEDAIDTGPATPISFFEDHWSDEDTGADHFEHTANHLNGMDIKDDLWTDDPANRAVLDAIARSKECSDKAFICLVCHRTFSRRHNFITHLETHNPNRRVHPCHYCSHPFTRAKDRDRHIVTIHERSEKFKCACGRGFPRNDSLMRHKSTGCDGWRRSSVPARISKTQTPSPKPPKRNQGSRSADKKESKRKGRRRALSYDPQQTAGSQQEEKRTLLPPRENHGSVQTNHVRATRRVVPSNTTPTSSYPLVHEGRSQRHIGSARHNGVQHRDRYEVQKTDTGEDLLEEEDDDGPRGRFTMGGDHDGREAGPSSTSLSSWDYGKSHF